MDKKIRILFHNLDKSGVNYYRTQTPAMELERNHSDAFHVEVNSQIDMNDPSTMDYLKSFDIIHYHRQFLEDANEMLKLSAELRKSGTILVVDIDDYWHLPRKHPYYQMNMEKKLHLPILANLKIADYVTTTTDLFAAEIKKVTGRNNVEVLFNSVDSTWMKQFQNNWKPDPDGLVRITYMGGSSHAGDVEQLEGVMNAISCDPALKNKFKVIVAGWDTEGNTSDISFNQDFGAELQRRGLWIPKIIKMVNKCRGNIDLIEGLPADLKEKYRDNIFNVKQRDIKSVESVYLEYEMILTDKHKMINNIDYIEWLENYERNVKYPDEGNYARRWTQKANIYANVLNETDIVIAPLDSNQFNFMKSNLKQVECWTRKLPIVCTDIPPYNVHGRHMENCILVKGDKSHAYKEWRKYLKKLILDADLRKKLGEQLHEDFKEKYNLANVTAKRAEFYKKIIDEKNGR